MAANAGAFRPQWDEIDKINKLTQRKKKWSEVVRNEPEVEKLTGSHWSSRERNVYRFD